MPGGSPGGDGAGGGGGGADASDDPSATAGGSRLPTPVFKQPKPSTTSGDDASDASKEPGAYGDETASSDGKAGSDNGGKAGKGDDGELDQVLGSIDQRIGSERERIRERAEEIGATGKLPKPDDAIATGSGNDASHPDGDGNPSNLPDLPSPSGSPQDVQARGPANPPPPDMPDDSSDDIVARQLREAATYEPDPELRAKLWNEYRMRKRNVH